MCKERQRQTVLVEREPEEDDHRKDREQRIQALFDFARILSDFGFVDLFLFRRSLWVGQVFLAQYEYCQREQHRHNRYAERIVESRVERRQIVLRERSQVGRGSVQAHLRRQFRKAAVRHFFGHLAVVVGMAQRRKVRVVEVALRAQPPVAYAHRGERRHHRADVDEHVENLESRVAQFGILFVVVELAHQRLEVALEQTVAERDDHQRADDQRLRVDLRHHQHRVAQRHDQYAGDDRPLVVAQPVSYQTARQGQDVDRGVEKRVDFARLLAVDAEFRHQEQRQDGHHGVEAEAFARVGEGRGNQTFGLFEHDPCF